MGELYFKIWIVAIALFVLTWQGIIPIINEVFDFKAPDLVKVVVALWMIILGIVIVSGPIYLAYNI